MDSVTSCAGLLGVDPDVFVETFMKPKLKVGNDYVKKGQNVDQVSDKIGIILVTVNLLYRALFPFHR